jgi:hypothetical protein
MTSAETIRAALLASGPLATLTASHIRSDMAEADDPFPFIVFKRISIDPTYGLSNALLARKDTFQVECWGSTRSQSSDVAELAILALAAAGLPMIPSNPDAIDPQILARAVVLNVELWVD